MRKLRFRALYSALYIYCFFLSSQWSFGTRDQMRKLMLIGLNCLIPCFYPHYVYYRIYSNGNDLFLCPSPPWHRKIKDKGCTLFTFESQIICSVNTCQCRLFLVVSPKSLKFWMCFSKWVNTTVLPVKRSPGFLFTFYVAVFSTADFQITLLVDPAQTPVCCWFPCRL